MHSRVIATRAQKFSKSLGNDYHILDAASVLFGKNLWAAKHRNKFVLNQNYLQY